MTGNIHLSIVLESGLCIYSVVRSHLLIIKHQRKIVGHIRPNKSGVNLLHCCNLRFLRSQFIFNFVFLRMNQYGCLRPSMKDLGEKQFIQSPVFW